MEALLVCVVWAAFHGGHIVVEHFIGFHGFVYINPAYLLKYSQEDSFFLTVHLVAQGLQPRVFRLVQ